MQGRFITAAAVAAVTCYTPAFGDVRYTITPIDVVPGDTYGFAYAINNLGQVAGFSGKSSDPRETPRHAYLYSNGQLSTLGIPANVDSQALGLNDLGQVVGQRGLTAFLYSGGQFTNISLGGAYSYATAINDASQVTGYAAVAGGTYHAFLYRKSDGSLTDFHPSTSPNSAGAAINSSGHVTGSLYNVNTGGQSFVYRNGQLTNLSTTAGLYTTTDINDGGTIVGYSTAGRIQVYSGSAVTTYPSTGVEQFPLAINNLGTIVGYSSTINQVQRAFLAGNGTTTDLNTLIDPLSGWTLRIAHDINDQGQIVGEGTDPAGRFRAFILNPVPEPGVGVVILMPLVLTRRRRSA